MQTNTFLRRGVRLLMAVLMLIVSVPSVMMAADDWDYPTKKPSNPFGGGDGSNDNPYIISTAQHLANLAYMVTEDGESYKGKHFTMTRDIVLNDNVIGGATKESNGSIRYSKNKSHFDALKRWQPIGMSGNFYNDDFEGIFDGGGHSISGIYCRKPLVSASSSKAYKCIGLFGNCQYAHIMRLTIKDSFFSICAPDGNTSSMVELGSLVGRAEKTTINNCHAENCVISGDGDLEGAWWYIGGLVGTAETPCNFYNSSFDGVIDAYSSTTQGKSFIGGLVGRKENRTILGGANLVVDGCSTKGTLIRESASAADDDVSGGYNKGVYVSGIVGHGSGLTVYDSGSDPKTDPKYNRIARCVNRMNIRVFTNKKGTFESVSVHGIIGHSANCTQCANFGNITVGNSAATTKERVHVGGICEEGNATDCFNYGNITAPGGASGTKAHSMVEPWVSTQGTVTDCFNYNRIGCTSPKYAPLMSAQITYNSATYSMCFNGVWSHNGSAESDYKSQDFVRKLNQAADATKYGLINDAADNFNGYLMLTVLGGQDNNLAGDGSDAAPYVISNANDLRAMAYMFSHGGSTSYYGKVFRLANNIDMTNEPELEAVGSFENPFDGVFDGNGYYIRGLKAKSGYLFHTVTGTVKNLALDDLQTQDKQTFAGIAYGVGKSVGLSAVGGTVESCCVTGDVELEAGNDLVQFGGICYYVGGKGVVNNCYYAGNVRLAIPSGTDYISSGARLGGIATSGAGGTISNCHAAFGYDTDPFSGRKFDVELGGIVSVNENATLTNDFYCCKIAASAWAPDKKEYDGATAVDKESEISADALGADAWKTGVCHPVLKAAYHYDCKDYNGDGVALDLVGYTPVNNDMLTLVPSAGQNDDAKMWQLPNVAVYSEDLDAEIVTGFNIIPDTETKHFPLRYKASKEGVGVKGLVTYPWAVKKNAVNWRMFCLPGTVELSSLPEGCKLYVGGKLVNDDTEPTYKYKMNIVEVETVPAGMPFLLRYDNQTDEETLNITMLSELSMTPQEVGESSSLIGTFTPKDGTYVHDTVNEETSADGGMVYLTKTAGYDCFSAYVADASSASRVYLIDYLLLDEQSNETDEIIADHNGKSVKVKLRRSIKTGGWNTVCLPFGISSDEIADALGSGTRIETLTDVSYDAATGSVVMKFGKATAIEAGKPYLIYPEKEATIFDLGSRTVSGTTEDKTFESVTLGDGSAANISMVGSFGKAYLASTDAENHYFLQADKFYRATSVSPVVMSGFRCWFKVTDASGQKAQALNAARVVHADGTVTAIRLVDTGLGTAGTRIYDIQGIRHDTMQRGLNIVGGKKIMK